MKLREYQELSLTMLYDWMTHNTGHPVLELPTGSGKSVVIATLCERAIKEYPTTRILMLVSSKELIVQNVNKLRTIWKGAPLGIVAASLNKKEFNEPITFANIGSIRNKSAKIGHIDLCIVDECDSISHENQGSYRNLINDLLLINPNMRVVGFTATPFRSGHGLITDKPAIFDEIIKPTSIEELIHKGYLAPLRSKVTSQRLSTEGVHKRGGDFIESELQAAVDKDYINQAVVDEVIHLASARRHWLFFCAGVEHAEHINDILLSRGIKSATLIGKTTDKERDQIILDFISGKIQALTNCNILTVGFDFPDLDCIVMLRPTMSARLFVQIAGRGTRLKSHAKDCLFLDFAGAVSTHGPITNVTIPTKAGSGNGEPPVRLCPECSEIVHISIPICPCCGTPFPLPEAKVLTLHMDDIMTGLSEIEVNSWDWRKQVSRTSGIEMLKVSYYGGLSEPAINEYITVMHDSYAGIKARKLLAEIASKSNVKLNYDNADLTDIAELMNKGMPPALLNYKRDGKFFKIIDRTWSKTNE